MSVKYKIEDNSKKKEIFMTETDDGIDIGTEENTLFTLHDSGRLILYSFDHEDGILQSKSGHILVERE